MYSPRIKDNQIKRLYTLKQKFNLPMTKMVETAIEMYLKKYEKLTKYEPSLDKETK